MLKLLSSRFQLLSLCFLGLLCAVCEVSMYTKVPSSPHCSGNLRYDKDFLQALFMNSEFSDPEENNLKFSITGLPVYDSADYDLEVKLRKLRGNYTLLNIPRWQMRDAIKNLSKTPKRRKCWQLSGSLRSNDKVKTSTTLQNYHVLSSLFCYKDVLEPLLINNITDLNQSKDRDEFESNCTKENVLIQESMYTEKNITTRDISSTTKCYKNFPCAHCEQEVIEIGRGDTMVWNIIYKHNANYDCRSGKPIPASTVRECFDKGGRFIKSIHVPDRLLRCVSTKCTDTPEDERMKVNSIDLRYNDCEEEVVEKLMTDEEAMARFMFLSELPLPRHVYVTKIAPSDVFNLGED